MQVLIRPTYNCEEALLHRNRPSFHITISWRSGSHNTNLVGEPYLGTLCLFHFSNQYDSEVAKHLVQQLLQLELDSTLSSQSKPFGLQQLTNLAGLLQFAKERLRLALHGSELRAIDHVGTSLYLG